MIKYNLTEKNHYNVGHLVHIIILICTLGQRSFGVCVTHYSITRIWANDDKTGKLCFDYFLFFTILQTKTVPG